MENISKLAVDSYENDKTIIVHKSYPDTIHVL